MAKISKSSSGGFSTEKALLHQDREPGGAPRGGGGGGPGRPRMSLHLQPDGGAGGGA